MVAVSLLAAATVAVVAVVNPVVVLTFAAATSAVAVVAVVFLALLGNLFIQQSGVVDAFSPLVLLYRAVASQSISE